MKTMRILFTVIALSTVLSTQAIDRTKMRLVALSSKKAMIAIANDEPSRFTLKIETLNGEEIYSQSLRTPVKDYKKVFNFKNLENGEYNITLEKDGVNVVNRFDIVNKKVKVYQPETRLDPYFKFKNNSVKLSFLNFDLEDVKLSVFSDGKQIYGKSLGKKFTIHAGLSFNKVPSNKYEVVLSTKTKEFNFEIEK